MSGRDVFADRSDAGRQPEAARFRVDVLGCNSERLQFNGTEHMNTTPKARPPGMSIGEISRRTGLSIDTIRYYERLGLLANVERTAGGHRQYGTPHVRRLRFVRHGRRLGLPLDQLRILAEREANSCTTFRSLLSRRAVEVRQQMAELRAIDRELRRLLEACGDGQRDTCSVVEAMLAGDEQAAVAEGACCGAGGKDRKGC